MLESGPYVQDDRHVPFFTQAAGFEAAWPQILQHFNEVADNGKYSHGQKVAELEAALARWTGAGHVVGVNSGTDALTLLLRACGLTPGGEVIVPAFSFIASASAVVLAGGRPAFADIEQASYGIDPAAAAAAVTERTEMIMPVHLFCQLADLRGVLDVAARHGLAVVEDSAEAIGMRWDGTHAGLLGRGGVLSFFPTKTLGAIGDAGAVITDSAEVAAAVSALRHHGRSGRTLGDFAGISNPTVYPGVNSKMDDIQAAVLLAKLDRLDADIKRREEMAGCYTERLAEIGDAVRTPRLEHRIVPVNHVWYVYVVEVSRRDQLAEYLAARGIGTEIYYPRPLHLQPCFDHLGYRAGDFPAAEAACRRTLALPLHPDLTERDTAAVCDAIKDFYHGARR